MTNHWKQKQQEHYDFLRNYALDKINAGHWTLDIALDFLKRAGVPDEAFNAPMWQGVLRLQAVKVI